MPVKPIQTCFLSTLCQCDCVKGSNDSILITINDKKRKPRMDKKMQIDKKGFYMIKTTDMEKDT